MELKLIKFGLSSQCDFVPLKIHKLKKLCTQQAQNCFCVPGKQEKGRISSNLYKYERHAMTLDEKPLLICVILQLRGENNLNFWSSRFSSVRTLGIWAAGPSRSSQREMDAIYIRFCRARGQRSRVREGGRAPFTPFSLNRIYSPEERGMQPT